MTTTDHPQGQPARRPSQIAAGTASHLRLGVLAGLTFCLAIALELALIFLPRYFVTVDGPFHLGVASFLRDVVQGHGALAFHYYRWHLLPVPNLLPDTVLAGLMTVVDPKLSEKLLMAGYVVGLPLALLYAIRGVSKDTWLAFFAFPLTFSFAFNYGFYNFSYSEISFLVVAGFTLRNRGQFTRKRGAILAGLLTLTYFTHVVGFLEAILFVAAVLGVDWMIERKRGQARFNRRTLILLVGVLMPSLVLAGWFFLGTRTAIPSGYALQPFVRLQLFSLALGVTSYSRYESFLTLLAALALAMLVVVVLRMRGRPVLSLRATDASALFSVVAGVAALIAPFQVESGGSFIFQRLALFPVFGVVLWVAAYPVRRELLIAAAAAALVAAVGLGVMRLPTYQKLDAIVTDFMSVEPCLAKRSTLLQASMAVALPASDVRLDPVTDETGRLAADLHGLDIGSVEGSVPFYLFQYRRSMDPGREGLVRPGGTVEGIPPPLNPLGYERRSGGRVDYVLLFGLGKTDPAILRSRGWVIFRNELRTGYRLVAVSPRGWVEAWERRDSPAARAGAARRLEAKSAVCRPLPAAR